MHYMDWLLEPCDLISSVMPLHLLSTFFGLNQCQIERRMLSLQPRIYKTEFKTNTYTIIYSLLLLTLHSYIIVNVIYNPKLVDYRQKNDISSKSGWAEFMLKVVNIYIFILFAIYNRDKSREYLKQLNDIHENLRQFNNELIPNTVAKYVRVYFLVIFTLLSGLSALLVYLWNAKWESAPILLLFMGYENLTIIQFSTMLKILQYQFENINKIFQKNYALKKPFNKWRVAAEK